VPLGVPSLEAPQALVDWAGDARIILLGEASHGTHEFYALRAVLTRRLIEERAVSAVAVEADWPDAFRVNRYLRGHGEDRTAEEALRGFRRFPAWMWRNRDVLEFVAWLKAHNRQVAPGQPQVGFYGLDLYSLHTSIEAVLRYLDRVDPMAAARARYRYSCFDHFGEDTQAYGHAAIFGLSPSCEREILGQLRELQLRAGEYARRDGPLAEDELFHAQQNARLVSDAEAYYRAMFQGRVASWNLRDGHMAETLEALLQHLGSRGVREPRVAVWAHNSHLGDARATEMAEAGELNLGQLARQRWGAAVFNLGMTTHTGTVTAASDWDRPVERKRVRPALPSSVEAIFHGTGMPSFALDLRRDAVREAFGEPHLSRAIGVIYHPATERVSHYFHTRLSDQFDAVVHVDETTAVEALPEVSRDPVDLAVTYPTGV
jgi:erythromycin esterase-like protein